MSEDYDKQIDESCKKWNEEFNKILKTIPKEHHKNIKKIKNDTWKIAYKVGVCRVKCMLNTICEIPPNEIDDYDIAHYTDLDGG